MKILATLIFLLGISSCYGQYRHILIKDTSAYNKYPFAIISDAEQTFKAYSYEINYADLIYNQIDSSGKYSKKGDYIQVYKLNPSIKLLNTDEILAKYHIKPSNYTLPIYIDSIIVRHRETACYQLSAIVSVKVQTDKITHKKYINIHSIHHTNNPFADIYIFGTYKGHNTIN